MTTFDKRKEGFEKQFAHDEELRFKATARRNRLLGLWAAEKLGLSGDDEVIVNVGRHEFQKGIEHLIHAVSLLPERRRLHLVWCRASKR